MEFPLADIQHIIAVLTGKEAFEIGKTLRSAHTVIGWLIEAIFPAGQSAQALTSLGPEANLAVALQALVDAETADAPAEGDVAAQFFDKLPIPKEMLLQLILSWLTKWINDKLSA